MYTTNENFSPQKVQFEDSGRGQNKLIHGEIVDSTICSELQSMNAGDVTGHDSLDRSYTSERGLPDSHSEYVARSWSTPTKTSMVQNLNTPPTVPRSERPRTSYSQAIDNNTNWQKTGQDVWPDEQQQRLSIILKKQEQKAMLDAQMQAKQQRASPPPVHRAATAPAPHVDIHRMPEPDPFSPEERKALEQEEKRAAMLRYRAELDRQIEDKKQRESQAALARGQRAVTLSRALAMHQDVDSSMEEPGGLVVGGGSLARMHWGQTDVERATELAKRREVPSMPCCKAMIQMLEPAFLARIVLLLRLLSESNLAPRVLCKARRLI